MEKTIDIIKSIDNDMAPRFGHTITLGKIVIIQFKNQKQYYSVEQQVLMDDSLSIQIHMCSILNRRNGLNLNVTLILYSEWKYSLSSCSSCFMLC